MTRTPLTKSSLRRPGAGVVDPVSTTATPAEVSPPAPSQPATSDANTRYLRDRSKQMVVYLNPEAVKLLKKLAAERDCKVHDLMISAVNRELSAAGLPQIAEPDKA